MKSADCDLVVLGTIIRETIGAIGEARKTGFAPIFLGSSAAYTDLIHKLGGKAMDGLYATQTVAEPVPRRAVAARSASGPTSTRPSSTRTRRCSRSTATASSTRSPRPRSKAGPNLTTDSFIKAMDIDDVPARHVRQRRRRRSRPNKRLGNDQSRLSQIQDGRWKVVSDYAKD